MGSWQYNDNMKEKFLVPIVVIGFIALVGGLFTDPGMTWYNSLNLPDITPSGGFIGSVWTVLYILIIISWIQFLKKGERGVPHGLYFINAILNLLWSYIFFSQHNIAGAFVEIWALNLSTVVLIYLLWKDHRLSAYLLLPYFAWVSFATYLNYLILSLN